MGGESSITVEILMREYDSLRQEILQTLSEIKQLKLTVISATAFLIGIAGSVKQGASAPLAYLIPFLLFILCYISSRRMRSARRILMEIAVYIELTKELNPLLKDKIAWERTCSNKYSHKNSQSLQSYFKEPFLWIAILMFAAALILASEMSCLISWIYSIIHLAFLISLLKHILKKGWINRDEVKSEMIRFLEAEGIIENVSDTDA